jgi:hypothetical protein
LSFQASDVGKIAVMPGMIKPVADNEFVWNIETNVIGMQVKCTLFPEQDASSDRTSTGGQE